VTSTVESFVTSVIELIADYLVATGNTRDRATHNVGAEYVNNVFEIRSHNWDDRAPYEPNFYFSEFDYRVDWYKYLGRGDASSQSLTVQQALYMLNRCLMSIDYNEVAPVPRHPFEWDPNWDQEPDEDVDF